MDFPKNIKPHTIILIIVSVISITISILLILDHTKSIPDIFNLHKQQLTRNSIEKYSSIDPVRSSIDPVRSSIDISDKLKEKKNNTESRLTYFSNFDTKCIDDNIDNISLIDTIIKCDLTTSHILNYCIRIKNNKNIDTKLCI